MKKYNLIPLVLLLSTLNGQASELNLSDKPLAVETEGVNPNIMLVLDKSGSMNVANSGNDVFYAPGYDADKEYRCSDITKPILESDSSKTLVVYISNSTKTGLPYFSYGGTFYVWNNNPYYNNKLDSSNTISGAVCFDPAASYNIKLQANKSSYYSSYYYANGSTETMDGNFLNWYFSSTATEWFNDTNYKNGGNGYTAYTSSNCSGGFDVSHDYWCQNYASSFRTSSENISVGTYTGGSKSYSLSNDGLKSGVSYKHERMNVAKDVAKKVVRDLERSYAGLAAYSGDSIKLYNGFVELDSEKNEATTIDNKEGLIEQVGTIYANNGTPTAKTLAGVAKVLFNGWNDKNIQFNGSQTQLSNLYGGSLSTSGANDYSSSDQYITADKFCQKNAVVIFTDGEPSSDNITSTVEDYTPKNVSEADLTTAENNGADSSQRDLIRLTGALYDTDLVDSMVGKQNIMSYFIGFGDSGVLNDTTGAFTLAAKAGGGGFYAATDGAAASKAFKDIISKVTAKSASVTAVAVSTVSEDKFNNYAIQANYDTEYWSGQLKAYRLAADGDHKGEFMSPDGTVFSEKSSGVDPVWEANGVMNNLYLVGKPATEVRKRTVYTYNGSAGIRFGSTTMTRPSTSSTALPEFTALPQAMREDLNRAAHSNSQQQYDLMMYLLGDVSNEVGFPSANATLKYRARGEYTLNASNQVSQVTKGGILGDITNSSPVYVKEPSRPWNDKVYGVDGKRYSDFYAKNKDRPAMIYVGSNRGFLHAFTIESGVKDSVAYPAGSELFAYMPASIASTLQGHGYAYLADKDYDHQFYVDLQITESDVFMDFYKAAAPFVPEWRSVIVGGLRGGGRGLFALDVTCPYQTSNTGSTCDDESFSKKNVLWEFTDQNDSDLGYTYAEPVIAKVNYSLGLAAGHDRNGNGKGRWAAIVSNGYNSTNGKAALFIIFLDGGLDGTWTEGQDYLKIVATGTNTTDKNGLSAPTAVDTDNDGIIDRVYAGDLKGQMWVFDLSQAVSYQQN